MSYKEQYAQLLKEKKEFEAFLNSLPEKMKLIDDKLFGEDIFNNNDGCGGYKCDAMEERFAELERRIKKLETAANRRTNYKK